MLREKHKAKPPRGESTDALVWGGPTCSSDEGSVMVLERRGRVRQSYVRHNWQQDDVKRYEQSAAEEGLICLMGAV
jgi:hypothetical protein